MLDLVSSQMFSFNLTQISLCHHISRVVAWFCGRMAVNFHSWSFCPFPELPQSEHISVADATWLALNVVSGGGNASNSQPIGVTKIAKSVIAPLADHNISVFMLSTYQTDFILVSADNSVPVLALYHVKWI